MAKKKAAARAGQPSAKSSAATASVVDRETALALLRRGADALSEWRSLLAGKATADLSGAELRGAKLVGFPLENATLDRADLSRAQLKEAALGRLRGATLDGARLAGATIRGLEQCSLAKADLTDAKLVGEKGKRPSLAGSNLSDAKLAGATSADLVADALVAERANFDGAIFERGSFPGANFRGASLAGAEFYRCDFRGADFTDADLAGAILARCDFTDAKLTNAKLAEANLAQSDLTRAVVSGADFANAALGGAITTGVDFATAASFEVALKPHAPRLEKNVDALVAALGKLTSGTSKITLRLAGGGRVELSWKETSRGAQAEWSWYREKHTRKPKTRPALGDSLREQLYFLGDLWGAGRLAAETCESSKSGSEVNNPTFERLALRAWFDAFGLDVESPAQLDRFDVFVGGLAPHVNLAKLTRALKMLQSESFQLFNEVGDDHVAGVVKSQSQEDVIYACRVTAEGRFACCDQELGQCMGMGVGSTKEVCKHILVLVLGLAKAEKLSRPLAAQWIGATAKRKSGKGSVDENLMSEILLRYKGAEVGELDWRPMETTPEDYYSF